MIKCEYRVPYWFYFLLQKYFIKVIISVSEWFRTSFSFTKVFNKKEHRRASRVNNKKFRNCEFITTTSIWSQNRPFLRKSFDFNRTTLQFFPLCWKNGKRSFLNFFSVIRLYNFQSQKFPQKYGFLDIIFEKLYKFFRHYYFRENR